MSMQSLLPYVVAGAVLGVVVGLLVEKVENKAYARGVRDCQAGTPSYTVTVENGVADTTYVYPSK
jgi:hypothetical protein